MSRLATSFLVILVLLALVVDTVVEAKKAKRRLEERSVGKQKSVTKRHESGIKGKEGKGRRWKEDKLSRGKQIEDKYLELGIADLEKRVRGSNQAETKEGLKIKKENTKDFCESEKILHDFKEEETEKILAECEDIECRSDGHREENTELERMEEDDPQEECLSRRKANKLKKNSKGVHDKTLLAHEENGKNCYYGL